MLKELKYHCFGDTLKRLTWQVFFRTSPGSGSHWSRCVRAVLPSVITLVESGEGVSTSPRMRHRAASDTRTDFPDWRDINSPRWLSLCLLTMRSLISYGCNNLLTDFCLVTPAASSLSQAPLLGISLPLLYWLIDSPIHLLQGGWQAGIWVFCLSGTFTACRMAAWSLWSFAQMASSKVLLLITLRDATKSLLPNVTFMKLLTNCWLTCLLVLRCKRELIFHIVTITTQLQTVSPGASCESWRLAAPRSRLSPGSAQSQIAAGMWAIPSHRARHQNHVRGALTRFFGTDGKKKRFPNTKLIDFQRQNNFIFFSFI